ncbi:hypothetical protein ACS0TY_018598 [Phlomoides rotata]
MMPFTCRPSPPKKWVSNFLLTLLKINSDAAQFNDDSVGFGFVVRVNRGDVQAAGVKRCRADGDSTLIEALVFRYACSA